MVRSTTRKRKSEVKEQEHDNHEKKSVEEPPQHLDPSNLTLKSIFHLTHQDELSSTFCLQSSDDFVVLKSKGNMGIMRLDNQPEYHQSKFQLSSRTFENSTYNVVETLKVNDKQVFKSMNHSQKNDAMLNCFLFPKCLPKTPILLKCHISPNTRLLPPISASLSSYGSLQLSSYHHDRESNESILQSVVELCELKKSSLSLGTLNKLDKLQEAADCLMFYDFSWCPEIIDSKRLLAALTRSRELIFCSIGAQNDVVMLFSKKLDSTVNFIKWAKHDKDHFLFVDGVKGGLSRYSIAVDDDGSIKAFEKVNESAGKLNIPISDLESSSGELLVVVAAKSHSVEIFNESTSITKYIGLSVTGITSISCTSPAFLITTLDNEVYYMEVAKTAESLTISTFARVVISNSQVQQEKFRAYGIATSRNKVLVYIGLYPEAANDHLSLKQPLHVTVSQFSLNDPYRILINNSSLRLTDYQDCVEVVRYVGTCKLESMASLTNMDYNIGLTEDFAYYLKVQLLVTNAKLVFYKARSDTIFDVTNETKIQIMKIIDVIHAYKVLSQFKPKKNHSKLSLLAIRCLSNAINDYVNEDIKKPPYDQAQQAFKKDLAEVLHLYKSLPCLKAINSELCYYCEANIDSDKLTCSKNHLPVRCPITKLQLHAAALSFCPRCNCNVMDFTTLKEVTGNDEQVCIYCDGYISLR